MEYKILIAKIPVGFFDVNVAAAAEKLASDVTQQIALGWEPQGGVVIGGKFGRDLLQAMIKRR